jgi:hypothetical protein
LSTHETHRRPDYFVRAAAAPQSGPRSKSRTWSTNERYPDQKAADRILDVDAKQVRASVIRP